MLRGDCSLRIPLIAVGLGVAALAGEEAAVAVPVSAASRQHLFGGQPIPVIVEFDGSAADRAAQNERARRNLRRDDAAILALRSHGYGAVKAAVEAGMAGADAARMLDYPHFPLALWQVSSVASLQRLQSMTGVRRVHENAVLRPVSVSDLSFINQPQTAAQGATGAGTTVAVIDGGLGNNYLNYPDFGSCTAVNTPPATCRVVYNKDYYPGASTGTVHGTNVSAIALGVAPGAKLAMFDVFNGSTATSADILNAMNAALSFQAAYNIVAINLSLADTSSHAAQCQSSVFASAITNASNAGIVTVAAAGNSGSKSGLADPACAPGAVSVGAVYDASYGTVTWNAAAVAGGQCTDTSAADRVACFSQSANYLSLLAPGSFVNAPSSAFQQSGTSQAAPHISAAVAVLRARYPAESLGETVQRLQVSGIQDLDPGNNLSFPRLNLLAAANQGTSLTLTGTGPTTATSGSRSTYSITVTDGGPLTATNVRVTDTLPVGATFVSATSGCSYSGGIVTCSAASLAAGARLTFNITVTWTVSGSVYDIATVSADQNNSAPAAQQTVSIGDVPDGDAPLPAWAYVLLALGLFVLAVRRRPAAAGLP